MLERSKPSSVNTVAIRQNPEVLDSEILPRQFRTFGKRILAGIFSSKFSFRLHIKSGPFFCASSRRSTAHETISLYFILMTSVLSPSSSSLGKITTFSQDTESKEANLHEDSSLKRHSEVWLSG